MKKIPLSQGKFALIDDEDYSEIAKYRWYFCKKTGDARRHDKDCDWRLSRKVLMHRQLTNAKPGLVVDHINGNRLDNRRSNLRVCTQAENCINTKPRKNKSGYTGVYYTRVSKNKPWQARVQLNNKQYHFGFHRTRREASEARDAGAKKLHGQFARLNRGRQ